MFVLLSLRLIEKGNKYPKYFTNKLTDADSENAETQLWLGFAEACEYLPAERKIILQSQSEEVGKLINYMKNNPGKFGVKI